LRWRLRVSYVCPLPFTTPHPFLRLRGCLVWTPRYRGFTGCRVSLVPAFPFICRLSFRLDVCHDVWTLTTFHLPPSSPYLTACVAHHHAALTCRRISGHVYWFHTFAQTVWFLVSPHNARPAFAPHLPTHQHQTPVTVAFTLDTRRFTRVPTRVSRLHIHFTYRGIPPFLRTCLVSVAFWVSFTLLVWFTTTHLHVLTFAFTHAYRARTTRWDCPRAPTFLPRIPAGLVTTTTPLPSFFRDTLPRFYHLHTALVWSLVPEHTTIPIAFGLTVQFVHRFVTPFTLPHTRWLDPLLV